MSITELSVYTYHLNSQLIQFLERIRTFENIKYVTKCLEKFFPKRIFSGCFFLKFNLKYAFFLLGAWSKLWQLFLQYASQ